MFCSKCGSPNDDNASQCTKCGTVLGASQPKAAIVQPIPNHMVQAILVTIMCCLPLGIPSIVYANKVNSLLLANDRNGALEASRKAMTWFWIALGCGILFWIIYIVFFGGLAVLSAIAEME